MYLSDELDELERQSDLTEDGNEYLWLQIRRLELMGKISEDDIEEHLNRLDLK